MNTKRIILPAILALAIGNQAHGQMGHGNGGVYNPPPSYYVPPYVPSANEIAAQQRAQEEAMRAQQEAERAQRLQKQEEQRNEEQRARDEARAEEQRAREEARATAEEAKRWAKEEGISKGYYKESKLSAAARLEARMMAAEQAGEWTKASNAIWDSKSKDPWAGYRKKLDDWDNSLAALSEKTLQTPASRSKRPILLPNGQTSTLEEKSKMDDNAYLYDVLKSPNGKKPATNP